jgi:probable rRNA maturation factor
VSDDDLDLDLTVEEVMPLPDEVTETSLHSLVSHALMAEGQPGSWEVSVQVTSDDGIQIMHREFMGLDSPTDIMTFPYEDEPFPGGETPAQGGDIVISLETAAANATDAGWTVSDELEFLVLHGVLHILGWDDVVDDDRAKMLARQSELLESWRESVSG